MLKSRTGFLLGAAALLLALSPEARNAARRWAVRGTEAILDLSERTGMEKIFTKSDRNT